MHHLKTRLILSVFFLTFSTIALAQSPTTDYSLHFYQGTTLVATYNFTPTDVVCGQAKITPPPTIINPSVARWDDPSNPSDDCMNSSPSMGNFISALSLGSYTATIVATNAVGSSPESLPSNPFTNDGPPAVLTGLRLHP